MLRIQKKMGTKSVPIGVGNHQHHKEVIGGTTVEESMKPSIARVRLVFPALLTKTRST